MRRVVIAAVALATACGQLPGVAPKVSTTQALDEAGGVVEEVVTEGGQAGQEVTTPAGTAGAAAGGTTTRTTTGGAGAGGSTQTGQASAQTGAADRTGITDDSITIGIHAPLTGAAPVESAAFQQGKDLYWRWLHNDLKRNVHGRTVRVIFRDDQYSPSTAVAVCKQMAQQERAFLLVGGAGADQIQACAQWANSVGVPYLSAGTVEAGLTNLSTYFTITATYKRQGPILAQLVYRKLQGLDRYSPGGVGAPDGDVKIAFVRPETPNFQDAEDGLRQGLQELGKDLDYAARVPKEDSPNLSPAIAQHVGEMRRIGIDVVAVVTAPVVTINMAQQAEGQAYLPRFVGPGITNGLNQVSNILCGNKGAQAAFHRATFFSPWPGWPEVMAGQFDPDYRKAADKYAASQNTISGGGDIILAFWGFSKGLHIMLDKAGRDVSRQSFIRMLDAGAVIENGLNPPIRYQPGRHFGVDQVHRLEADCTRDNAFHHAEAFVSGY